MVVPGVLRSGIECGGSRDRGVKVHELAFVHSLP